MFGFPKLGCGRGKLPRTIGNACLQAFVERQQPSFKCFAFGDVVIDASYPQRTPGVIPRDLAFSGDPMKAGIGVRDPKFYVIRAFFSCSLDRRTQLWDIIEKDRRLPVS